MDLNEQIDLILADNPNGIRAKYIAKKIGVDKKTVNSYLHSHTSKYKQDDDWKWTLANITQQKVAFNSSKNVSENLTKEKQKPVALSEYIDDMIESFSFSNEEDFLNADLTKYIGEEVNPQFSSDLRRKLRFKKLITHGKLQRMLEAVLGKGSKFREGQEEAILALAEGKHVLVVQHTGWGKSLVYFLTTKLFREQGRGPTIIVSPLIALMHNQIESAEKYGLVMKQITSDTKEEWPEIYRLIDENKVDVIFLSPERLADEKFMEEFNYRIKDVSLFAVDEAHCISDWGHDFRPDFRRIVKYVKGLPVGTPILATTATANNRVLRDIKHQLGQDLEIQRGTMDRPSIDVDVLHFHSDKEKDAWLKRNILNLSGTGIIYCLTKNSCEHVYEYLSKIVPTAKYYSTIPNDEKLRIEKEFQNNRIKALVATVAFGMGIDKPDIGFVVHYHQPANAVAYYQQIGRAGRNVPHSYAIALVGDNDNSINSYFISNAFPTEDQMDTVIEYIINNPYCRRKDIMERLDVNQGWVDKVIKYLLVNGDIGKNGYTYYKTSRTWNCDMTRARIVSWYRWKELKDFNSFLSSDKCYMQYIRNELDDIAAKPCMRCSNCKGKHFFI